MDLEVREYGKGPVRVIAIHGGPAACGDLAPLARRLGERWHVLEPYQRGSGQRPLSVATHVQDLHDLILARCNDRRPILVGHSWGAMLALAYAASHPETPASLVLIGCGTFCREARTEFEARLEARLSPTDRKRLAQAEPIESPDQRLTAKARVITQVYGYDIEETQEPTPTIDSRAHRETWADMVRLQEEGVYPQAFAGLTMPILMLHGDVDPHPGRRTWQDLQIQVPQIQYSELARCGHSPWLERHAATPFYDQLHRWIERHS